MSEHHNFEKLDIKDPTRPIKVVGTVDADVPEASRRFLNHKVDQVVFPNGNQGWHHRIIVPEGVMLAHLDPDEKLALVTNYRHPIGRHSVELPSGGAEPEEGAALLELEGQEKEDLLTQIALREFEEELGWKVDPNHTRRMFKGPLQGSVGFADQTYHIFRAEGGEQSVQKHDDGEEGLLTHDRYEVSDAAEMVGREIVDPATATAVKDLAAELGHRSDNLNRISSHRTTIPVHRNR